jgi:hypothetical protein
MNITEFQDRLDAHGADPAAWPEPERLAAERLIASDAAARGRLERARELDALLSRAAARDAPADAAAGARVLAAVRSPLPPQRRSAWSWIWPAALLDVDLAPARLRIAALGGVAALGIMLGLFGPDLGDAGAGASAPPDTTIAAMFEPEPLTGVRP